MKKLIGLVTLLAVVFSLSLNTTNNTNTIVKNSDSSSRVMVDFV